jgi:hypothetical protein
MNAFRYTSPAAALACASHLTAVCHNLLTIADPRSGVEIGQTARMDGEHVAAVQDQTLSIWYVASDIDKVDPDEFYVCSDAGPVGGPVLSPLTSDNAWVPAEYIDGEHRLLVATGELIDGSVAL